MDREPETPEQLAEDWRHRAERLRAWGADPRVAELWETAATELEAMISRWDRTTLCLSEAARESGYSVDHLGELVRSGQLPNAGRPNAPRIRRSDLPIKSPAREARPPTTERPVVQDIASRLTRG